ncbi:hypothetical protein Rsub_01280 [Raphidocelis subcapitata]|uniref:EF-hand domain-containing protein n=1 Tax=Raphidocelis subcapitata TaxID=307507 RepID=A0A2V0NUR2_9CHLO|nr:hypothetical protein Rsub_01280 [Raphidocelis subcapitata]|eukprot:GBF88565.1 hypothetical protein Rsub_01280 [Raphidocelis subcapitata]
MAASADASIAVAHLRVCSELNVEPCEEFLSAVRSGGKTLKLRTPIGSGTLFAAASLLHYAGLEEVDVSGLRLDPEGWQALLEACGKCSSLQVLSIKGCSIGELDPAVREHVAQLLGRCSMGVLDASQNALGDDFAAALAAAGLVGSARLAVLDLSENAITCVGAAHLAAALESAAADRCALRQLDLGFNAVGDAGAAALARALPAVASLAALELESNAVGDDGALALAEAVRMAPSLQRLNLNFNRLSGRAVAGLADALLCSPGSLHELTLAGACGPGTDEALAALLRAVPACGAPLQLLDVRGPALDGDALEAAAELLSAARVPLATLRADVARKEGAERLAQALPTNASLVNLMLGGPVPEHVLSFIGAVLSSNAAAAAAARAGAGAGAGGRAGSPGAGSPGGGSQGTRSPGAASPEPSGGSPGRARRPPAAPLPPAGSPPRRPFVVGGSRSPGAPAPPSAARRAMSRTLTAQARSAGALDPIGLTGLSGGGGADKAAEVFRRHDVDESGYLDSQEMIAALADLGMLEGLTARQLGKFVSKVLREPGCERSGQVSLGEFIDYYNRIARHYDAAARQGRIVARRRQPAPPLDAASDEQLRRVFRAYCKLPVGRGRQVGASVQHMNAAQFRELARDAALVEPAGPLSHCAVDIVFTRCQAPGHRRLAYREFLSALAGLAEEGGRRFADVRDAIAAAESGVAAEAAAAAAAAAGAEAAAAAGGADALAQSLGLSSPRSCGDGSGGGGGGDGALEALYRSVMAGGGGQQPARLGGAAAGSPPGLADMNNPLYAPRPPGAAAAAGSPQVSPRLAGAGASAFAALAARVEALEAAGARRQKQVDAVIAAQVQLAAEMQRLAGSRGGAASPRGPQLQRLASQLAAIEAAVGELQDAAPAAAAEAAEAAAGDVERRLADRQARVESALMQVARQVDVLDVRLREEQETSLKALEAILTGGAGSPARM